MSKDRISLNQLIRIAEDKTWEDFEAMPDGRLLLQDRAQTILPEEEEVNPLLWVFEMRVGKHFERPMQAIMSCGHFIRMRSADSWGVAQLGKLDPAHPDNCLYAKSTPLSWGWRPYIQTQAMPYYGTVQPPPSVTLTTTSSRTGQPVWLAPTQPPPPATHTPYSSYSSLWSMLQGHIMGNTTP
jgi:hypothetical protein